MTEARSIRVQVHVPRAHSGADGTRGPYSGDRIEPAIELVERGDSTTWCSSVLAERTIALAQQAKARDPLAGFDPLLRERMEAVLAGLPCARHQADHQHGSREPAGGRRAACAMWPSRSGLKDLTIAIVTGDDVATIVSSGAYRSSRDWTNRSFPVRWSLPTPISAPSPSSKRSSHGADVVITGRVADPVAVRGADPHRVRLDLDDWPRVGLATLAGHLLECAGQVTGGYFADPG